jgi:hypothetical protein
MRVVARRPTLVRLLDAVEAVVISGSWNQSGIAATVRRTPIEASPVGPRSAPLGPRSPETPT